MCGIAGYWARPGERPQPAWISAMCDALLHRGPDGSGHFCDDQIALGHRRLSIIDLAGGHQPLGNEDGNLQIVFNGEIYNYLELRAGLVQRGHCFRTQSDTEVLVHLYEEAGERLPEYLNGMFALAIWDRRKRELFLARDRFGEKPLYYAENLAGTRFAFGSELKAFTALPQFNAAISAPRLADFLALSYVPDPGTIYQGICKLLPGHSLLVKANGFSTRRYWQIKFDAGTPKLPDTLEELRALTSDAVQRRMISDVPLGAFLSGGVDSAAVVGLMSQHSSRPVKTFSIGFQNKEFDELSYARLVADRYHTEHSEEIVDAADPEMLDMLSRHFDEPFGDSSAIPMLHLAKMTRKHVTVALSGDGADEIFGGYRRYYFGILEEKLRSRFPEWFRASVIRVGAGLYPKFDYLPQVFRAKTLLQNLSMNLADSYFTSMSTFRDTSLDDILSPELQRQLAGYSPRESFRARFAPYAHLPPLTQLQAVDLETYLPGDILVKTDRATMAYSLESRPPWLDHRLAELGFRLPPEWHIRGSARKHLFKQVVAPLVPAPILERPKMGFSVPLSQWFKNGLCDHLKSSMKSSGFADYFNQPGVERIIAQHLSGQHNHQQKLWNILIFVRWREKINSRVSDKNAAE